MSHVRKMLETHPRNVQPDLDTLSACIQACMECAQCCTSCADACLGEQHVADMVRCIRLNLDCADLCTATERILTRQTEPDWAMLRDQVDVLARTCRACGDECASHAEKMKHCAVCAESCRACEQACKRLVTALGDYATA